MKRREPTVSVRIRQSDYDVLIAIMEQEHARTVTDAASFAIHTAAMLLKNTGTCHVAGPGAVGEDDPVQRVQTTST